MDNNYKEQIAREFRNCVNNTISRIEGEPTYRPFHVALLSEDAIFWSRFERSFSTSFGQRVIEEIAKIVALSNGAEQAARQKISYLSLDSAILAGINEHVQSLRNGNHTEDWNTVVNSISRIQKSGSVVSFRVISDLWWEKNGINYFVSLKTVKPNIDQTAVAKEDCLKLLFSNPTFKPFFGLPYNPYGENKADYAFNPPMGIFNFHRDPVVLIGKEMWDTIGGPGCYEEILEIAKSVGEETRALVARIHQ